MVAGSGKYNINASGTAQNYFAGNVGIGTTTPESRVHILGTSNGFPATSGTSQPNANLRLQNIGSAVLDFGTNTSSGAWIQSTDRTSLAANYPLLLNPNGGNVGIRTTAPLDPLHVIGNIRTSSLAGTGDRLVKANANGVLGIDTKNYISALKAIGSTPNANGATLTGDTLNLQPASTSFGGIVTTGVQSFAGAKTFTTSAANSSTINATNTATTGIVSISGNFSTTGINASGNNYGISVEATGGNSNYGINIKNTITAGTGKWALASDATAQSYFQGSVGIGTTTPNTSSILDLTSTTGALIVPRMTTTQKNALTAVNGMIIYDTTLNEFAFYENGAWVSK